MQILRSAQDIAGTIKRHQLTGPTWLIAEGGYGAETTADQLEHLGITTMTARPYKIVADATGELTTEHTPPMNRRIVSDHLRPLCAGAFVWIGEFAHLLLDQEQHA